MIEIDGSQGEGGGQIARTAMALSCLTGKIFKITKIRKGRTQPGLKSQHLEAINALKQICGAKTNEVELGSEELHFIPGKIKGGHYEIDIKTAGSITLLLQALLLPSMFASSKVTLKIRGGTSGKWQASVDYLQNILLPHLRKFVEKIDLKIIKRGYYPKGGGLIEIEISPKIKVKNFSDIEKFLDQLEEITRINLTEQGKLEQIKGIVNCSRELQQWEVAERIKMSSENELKKLNCPTDIRMEYADSFSNGGEVVLWSKFSKEGEIDLQNPIILGGDALAEKGKNSEQVGKEAADELIKEIRSEGCVDKHLADQILVFMALLPGSKVKVSEVTSHCKTNKDIIELFLPIKFNISDKEISVERYLK